MKKYTRRHDYFEYSSNTLIHFVECGDGIQPILFLHGFGDSERTWIPILSNELLANYRCFLLDMKGFGKSSKPKDDNYSTSEQARIVTSFCMWQSLEDLTVIGHSYGGGVALVAQLVAHETGTELFSRLILEDPAAYVQQWPDTIRFLQVPLLGRFITLVPASLKTQFVISEAFFKPESLDPKIVSRYRTDYSHPGTGYTFRQAANQMLPDNYDVIVKQYSSINVPTLIIWGRHDQIIPIESGKRLHRSIPHSRFSIVEECGHVPHEETPELFIQEVSRFVKER